ncbi:unnamed protein product, partial [Medioppia subpectinata]
GVRKGRRREAAVAAGDCASPWSPPVPRPPLLPRKRLSLAPDFRSAQHRLQLPAPNRRINSADIGSKVRRNSVFHRKSREKDGILRFRRKDQNWNQNHFQSFDFRARNRLTGDREHQQDGGRVRGRAPLVEGGVRAHSASNRARDGDHVFRGQPEQEGDDVERDAQRGNAVLRVGRAEEDGGEDRA